MRVFQLFAAPFQRSSALILFVLMSSVCASVAQASVRIETNIARVTVPDQSTSSQRKAVTKALSDVLIKMTGQPDAVRNPALRSAIRSASQYLLSYRFEITTDNELQYVAEFDKDALMTLLREQELPVWGERRPESLVWLAIEGDDHKRFILDEGQAQSQQSEIANVMTQVANDRGIRLSLPLMDLTDTQAISVYDVWGRFAERLSAASARYTVDGVLGARLYKPSVSDVPEFEQPEIPDAPADETPQPDAGEMTQSSDLQTDEFGNPIEDTDDGAAEPTMPFTSSEFEQMNQRAKSGDYALDWVLIRGADIQFGSLYGDSPDELVASLVNEYATYLGGQYAIVPGQNLGEDHKITIWVANMDSLENYVKAQRYLSSLSVVSKATLSQTQGTVAAFDIWLMGSYEDLLKTLSLEPRLNPVTDAFGQPVEGNNFYWNP